MKYFTIFSLSLQNEFSYRLNFVLWRFRNVLRFLMTFFLWQGVFYSNKSVFGYSQQDMLTYVFLVLVISTFVLSAPSAENIGGEIARGDLSNYLVKPVNYLKYWFTRDISSKFLNLIFAVFEIGLLLLILKPDLKLPPDLLNFFVFLLLCILAMVIYFSINITAASLAFWRPEDLWGSRFFIMILIETLAGTIFPLDILPDFLKIVAQFTPFPYLVYFPVSVFLGKIAGWEILRIFLQTFAWTAVMLFASSSFWKKGLKVYGAEGK